MTMISNKNRLKTGNVSVLNRASAGIGIAGLSGIAAAQSASAQTNFQSLPRADYLIDQATGAARVTYQGQLYQVNAGHYIVNADGSISISSQAAATVAPGLSNTTVSTSGAPVDGSGTQAAAVDCLVATVCCLAPAVLAPQPLVSGAIFCSSP